jgi:L-iditol 2-dehydrogenase
MIDDNMVSHSTMNAMRLYKPKLLKYETVKVPEISKGEILVKNHVTLTCGTDLKMYKRGHPYAKLPLIIGHEFAGEVERVNKVTDFQEGNRVVAANSAPCNECFYCKKGKHNLCRKIDKALIGFTCDGAYAEYIRVPHHIVKYNTHVVPDHVSYSEAALLEPLACVIHGFERTHMQYGDHVVIIGAGPIGLMHLQLAKKMGCEITVVTGKSDNRLAVAKELGATTVINASKEDPLDKVGALTDNIGADIVIEAAGLPKTWEQAVMMTRKGGTVLLFGGCKKGMVVSFDTYHIHYGELTILGVFHHTPDSVKKALALLSSKVVSSEKIITHEETLPNLEIALHMMDEGKASKIAIKP